MRGGGKTNFMMLEIQGRLAAGEKALIIIRSGVDVEEFIDECSPSGVDRLTCRNDASTMWDTIYDNGAVLTVLTWDHQSSYEFTLSR